MTDLSAPPRTPWPPGAERSLIPPSLAHEPVEPMLVWAYGELARLGHRVVGEPAVRRRDWSTVVSVATDRGPVWIKANAREFAFEAALVQLLVAVAGDHVLAPLAVQEQHGWFMTPDGGTVLEEQGPATEEGWTALLVGYADLQQRIQPRTDDLLRIGLSDMSPLTLADWLVRTLDRASTEEHVAAYLTAGAAARLRALVPATLGWGVELAGDGIGVTVEHNDLHANNVFSVGSADGDRADRRSPSSATPTLRIFDWADAIVTHPFVVLGRATALPAEAQQEWCSDPGDRPAPPTVDVDAVRDAYLRCWAPGAIPVRLRRSATLAEMLSDVVLAASWLRLPHGMLPDWAEYFVAFLHRYLQRAEALLAADLERSDAGS